MTRTIATLYQSLQPSLLQRGEHLHVITCLPCSPLPIPSLFLQPKPFCLPILSFLSNPWACASHPPSPLFIVHKLDSNQSPSAARQVLRVCTTQGGAPSPKTYRALGLPVAASCLPRPSVAQSSTSSPGSHAPGPLQIAPMLPRSAVVACLSQATFPAASLSWPHMHMLLRPLVSLGG